jgi:hypothetical protein
MFGRGAEYGQATIGARTPHDGLYHMKNHTGIYRNIWDYIADVQPESGSAFRATFTELFEGFDGRQPDVGEQARVKFDAKHQKVEFDRSALREEYAASKTAQKERLAAIASAAPGTTPSAPSGGTSTDGGVDLAASTADFSDTFAAIKRAREAGDLAEVERLKAEYRRRSG